MISLESELHRKRLVQVITLMAAPFDRTGPLLLGMVQRLVGPIDELLHGFNLILVIVLIPVKFSHTNGTVHGYMLTGRGIEHRVPDFVG